MCDYMKAANWWRNTIEETKRKELGTSTVTIPGIDDFTSSLAIQMKELTSKNGNLFISTCDRNSKLLNEIALQARLGALIPKGYEMRIVLDEIRVFNASGRLLATFY